jgi:CarD family transcriptional regulator
MKPGDYAFYPKHGVVELKRIDDREIAGKRKKFYVFSVLSNAMTIMVPMDLASNPEIGLRKLSNEQTIKNALELIRDKKSCKLDDLTWNIRYRRFMEMIGTGDIMQIATVLRSLAFMRRARDLSFGERKTIDSASHTLAVEAALVMKISVDHAAEMIVHAMEAA